VIEPKLPLGPVSAALLAGRRKYRRRWRKPKPKLPWGGDPILTQHYGAPPAEPEPPAKRYAADDKYINSAGEELPF